MALSHSISRPVIKGRRAVQNSVVVWFIQSSVKGIGLVFEYIDVHALKTGPLSYKTGVCDLNRLVFRHFL